MKSNRPLPYPLRAAGRAGLRTALAGCAGLRWIDDYRGELDGAARSATVTLGVDGVVLVRAWSPDAASAQDDLRRTGTLPGNLRLGSVDGKRSWFAELDVEDGVAAVEAGLADVRAAIAGRDPTAAPLSPPSTAQPSLVDFAREVLGDDNVVELPDGVELRPRLIGRVVPLTARRDGAGVRLTRVVLRSLPGPTDDAVAHHARALEVDLRHCRLALDDGVLVVETRTTLCPAAFVRSVRAVAAAYAHVHLPLTILARDELVARCYEQAFCGPHPIGAV